MPACVRACVRASRRCDRCKVMERTRRDCGSRRHAGERSGLNSPTQAERATKATAETASIALYSLDRSGYSVEAATRTKQQALGASTHRARLKSQNASAPKNNCRSLISGFGPASYAVLSARDLLNQASRRGDLRAAGSLFPLAFLSRPAGPHTVDSHVGVSFAACKLRACYTSFLELALAP